MTTIAKVSHIPQPVTRRIQQHSVGFPHAHLNCLWCLNRLNLFCNCLTLFNLSLGKTKEKKIPAVVVSFSSFFLVEICQFSYFLTNNAKMDDVFYKVDLKFKHFLLWQMINNLNAHTRHSLRRCRRTSQMTTIKAISAVNTLTVDCCYAISDS